MVTKQGVKLRAIAARLEREAGELRRLADMADGVARVTKSAAKKAKKAKGKKVAKKAAKKRVAKKSVRKVAKKVARKVGVQLTARAVSKRLSNVREPGQRARYAKSI